LAKWAPRLRESAGVCADSIALNRLVDAARLHLGAATTEFDSAVRKSSAALFPFGEPLEELDFTEHRWAAGHREEAYSDWLQWIFVQIERFEIPRILGIRDSRTIEACIGAPCTIVRERRVKQGHEGSTGRLDLHIRFGDSALIVVEVKLSSADHADTQKDEGYRKSVEAEEPAIPFKAFVILTPEAEDEDYDGFKPRRWADACIELRVAAARLCGNKGYLTAGMILGFTAAVEQNLLGFRRRQGRPPGLRAGLLLQRTTRHLTEFIEELGT
jgi:hypothetical protein